METSSRIVMSCLTPTLNSEKYLEVFLSQLARQDLYPNFEVILNMSAPSAKELEIANRYKQQYGENLKMIIHDEVIPLGVAWNECIAESRGEFLAIWNVDDLRTDCSLSAQLNSLMNSDAVVSYGPYKVVNSFESTDGRLILETNLTKRDFLRGMHFGPFMTFRKSVLEFSGLFDEQLYSGGDYDLSVRLALQGDSVRVDDILGYYLDAGIGASTAPNSKQIVERTVIELRYATYDKIDWKFLNNALDYDIKNIHFGNHRYPVSSFRGVSVLFDETFRSQNSSTLRYFKNFFRKCLSFLK